MLKFGGRESHRFDVPLPGNCVKVRLAAGAAGGGANSHRADWVDAGFRTK